MAFSEHSPRTRDPKLLLREMDATLRIREIEKVHRCRERIQGRWYDSGVAALLFVSGLGILITVFRIIPASTDLLFWFVFGWVALFILSLIATLEVLHSKTLALRELCDWQARELSELSQQVNRLSHQQSIVQQSVPGDRQG